MRVKYPRTCHLPFSPGVSSDDKVLKDLSQFADQEVVVTVKMDGENSTLYSDGFHARSIDSRHHISRDWLAQYHASIAHNIPEGWRVCGENLYARHSIAYTHLPSYFLGFSIWDDTNTALSWDDTLLYFAALDIRPVETIWRGQFDELILKSIAARIDTNSQEGFVVRTANSFHYSEFKHRVAKWVRPKHVNTSSHWMHATVVPNTLHSNS